MIITKDQIVARMNSLMRESQDDSAFANHLYKTKVRYTTGQRLTAKMQQNIEAIIRDLRKEKEQKHEGSH